MNNEPLDLSSGRWLNESAIREHALECSRRVKGGKFTRVGQDFTDEVKADVEALLRLIRSQHSTLTFPEIGGRNDFTTGNLNNRLDGILNDVISKIIQRKVEKQPSRGITLGRTR